MSKKPRCDRTRGVKIPLGVNSGLCTMHKGQQLVSGFIKVKCQARLAKEMCKNAIKLLLFRGYPALTSYGHGSWLTREGACLAGDGYDHVGDGCG